MVSICHCAGLRGIDGYPVAVECSIASGLPRLDIVGLPGKAVSESAERIRSAAAYCSLAWPSARLTINLAPADTRKEGAIYDLGILLAVLAAAGTIRPLPADAAFFGELSLSGELRPVSGALSMALAARDAGRRQVFLPAGNAAEAAFAEGIAVYPASHLQQVVDHLAGRKALAPCQPPPQAAAAPGEGMDFEHVLGQSGVRRALEIAAAGGHNVLLCGVPGSGKSLSARCFPTIMPPMTSAERLEVIRVWSALGMGAEAAHMAGRPFRAPHHTISAAAMAGGGSAARLSPGEVSLAHRGVLFLDELPEFHTDVLEVLRQPMEDGFVSISRTAGKAVYPARFQLLAAMNPCKCGWYGTNRCTCAPEAVRKYLRRLSGPLMDRIDLQVDVQPVRYEALAARGTVQEESSVSIRARVAAARQRQLDRYAGTDISCNADLPVSRIAQDCPLSPDAEKMLESAFERMGLTARAYDRILRVARTIADLAGVDTIGSEQIAETIQYRQLDRLGISG